MRTWMHRATRVARVLQRFGIDPSENRSSMICYGYSRITPDCNMHYDIKDDKIISINVLKLTIIV